MSCPTTKDNGVHTMENSENQAAVKEDTQFPGPLSAALMQTWSWAAGAQKFLLVFVSEILLAVSSYVLAVSAMGETRSPAWTVNALAGTLGLLVAFRFGALASVRLYRRSLRYASIPDLISIAKAVTGSSILFCAFVWWQYPSLKIPAAVFAIDWAFLQLFWGGLHFGVRVLKAQQAANRRGGRRVAIVGAGDAGIMLLKDMLFDPGSPCRPVALFDDNAKKWGRTIFGIPIVGGTKDLATLAVEKGAEEILICIPSATPAQMRQIYAACRESNIPVRTLPSLAELMDGKVSRRDLRRPRIEDLLQREEIHIDASETRKIVAGKVVLVTGAGGSIGSELCRQIAEAGPHKLLLLDKSENSLFYANLEAVERLGPGRPKPIFADLQRRERVREILLNERPDIIFHAAAHKHVGLMELHPREAIRNNVLGTRNLAVAALECGVERFVNISTDKAVQPRNYMGLSKKLTELCVQEMARQYGAHFMNVRFGNVAGSTGSVLRLFWDQIQKGGPIRVSDPRATRYFMSVPEAVHLILRAAALGKGGETFVFEMGEALNIYELAQTMSLFAGLKPGRDLAIEFTGLGEGEKIDEELWEEWERPAKTSTPGILVITEQDALAFGMSEKIGRMEELLDADDHQGLLDYLQETLPSFQSNRKRSAAHAIPALPAGHKLAAEARPLPTLEVA